MHKTHDIISEITDESDNGAWIVTYADLVTLLLVFFILLFSMSSLDLIKFKKAVLSIQVNLGDADPAIQALKTISSSPSGGDMVSLADFTGMRSREDDLLEDIDDVIREETVGDNIVLKTSEGTVSMLITGTALFSAGEAELNEEADSVMNRIAGLVAEYPEYNINIKGYTDNVPIATDRFPSNWELSAFRATTVLKYLVSEGIDPVRMTATGYGELMPIVPNDSDENRAKNRRVEFVLEKKKSQRGNVYY